MFFCKQMASGRFHICATLNIDIIQLILRIVNTIRKDYNVVHKL